MPVVIAAGLTSYETAKVSVVSPKFQPAWNAARFASRIAGLDANRFFKNTSVDSTGRPYSHDNRPSENMFLARAASLRDSPNSLTDSTVIDVRSSSCRA